MTIKPETAEDKEILDNIYNYIIEQKKNYTFKRDGIHSYITADYILKVVEISTHGIEIKIILDDGINLYEQIIQSADYSKKIQDLVAQELEHSEHKILKYKKDDRRKFYKIAKSLKSKKLNN